MSNEFQNDAIISFLLNSFPVDSTQKSSVSRIEKYNDLENLENLETKKKDNEGFIQRVLDFFKMYWFLLFVFFIILLFVLWKKYLKKN